MFGGGSKIRSFWSLLSLIFLSVSSGLTIMGVISESKSTTPDAYWALPYVIPSAIMNVLCVILLIYLVATLKGKSNFYKLVVAFLLISGLVAEVYMTTLLDMTNTGQEAGTWVVIILNWLFRTFYVLEFVQEEWSPLFPAAKDVAKAVSSSTSSTSSSSSSSSSSGSTDVKKELKTRLMDYVRRVETKIKSDNTLGTDGAILRFKNVSDVNGAVNKESSPALGDLPKFIRMLEFKNDTRAPTSILASGGRR